ncbi:MAG: phenylpyruvate tautomerase MIF-related protein [Chitinispirillaceae bacterium]
MPLLSLTISKRIDAGMKESLLSQLSSLVAKSLQKPEKFVMVTIEEKTIVMSATTKPAAFAVLSSIGGIDADSNREFSQNICSLLKDQLGIEQDRVYLHFSDVPGENWGWNGSTFAK